MIGCTYPYMHLLKNMSVNGTYKIIRGDGYNLVGLDDGSIPLGLHTVINNGND